MKNKLTTLKLILLALLTVLFIVQCKKGPNENLAYQSHGNVFGTPPLATTKTDIDKQLRWIARGYPQLLNTIVPTVKNYLVNYLSTKDGYIDVHDNLNPDAILNISIDLEDGVYNSVQSNFTVNDYDRNFYYGFMYDDCEYRTALSIVDTIDASLPWVFTYEQTSLSDTTWAYFLTSGNLDSIQITSDNYDLYMIFLVSAENMCLGGSGGSMDAFGMGCNSNGVCEPQQGETPLNCIDCPGVIAPNEKTLKIIWARVNEDMQMFDESWGQNRYELGWDWAIADGTAGIIQMYRESQAVDRFASWTRKQVPINRNSRKGLKGTVTQKSYQNNGPKILYHEFDSAAHDLYFRFWEDDKFGSGSKSIIMDPAGNDISFAAAGFDDNWYIRTKGGTFHEGGFAPGGIMLIPKGSVWSNEIFGGVLHRVIEVTSPGQNEITIKVAFVP